MKRFLCLVLTCILLCGCAPQRQPALSDFLPDEVGSVYRSAFGFSIDLTDLTVSTARDIAERNGQDTSNLEDTLTRQMETDGPAPIFAAKAVDDSYLVLSMIPTDKLARSLRTTAAYADEAVGSIPEMLEPMGCTDIQIQRTQVTLGQTQHPAVSVSCSYADGSPYDLLQIYFCEGDWMGTSSLAATGSPESIASMLTRISAS